MTTAPASPSSPTHLVIPLVLFGALALLGLWGVPTRISPSTFSAIATVLIGGAIVVLNTVRRRGPLNPLRYDPALAVVHSDVKRELR
jgi:hypothetical protein